MSDLSQPLPLASDSTGTKRKSTAGASSSKRAKTSQSDPFADTKNAIQMVLASPESFVLPSGDGEYRKLVVSIAQYAKSLEGSVAVAGNGGIAAPPAKTPEQVSAEAERIINQINRGISKLMVPSCKTGSAKFALDGVCTDPQVFGRVLGLNDSPNFKTKKYTKEEFENLVGEITKDVRYASLSGVNVRYDSGTGEFKISGSYGKPAH
ncbi:hypothetical protein AG1IA_09256 [Rhizoctonia solani AG-1 IA]|uniref:Uncharacterized protein n=1 Tax=Thanatephorus cucumeris (strain AG1-IA) TaxID=983506 RepID=L8WFH7_THACA|nr:hypothetical protein AG1IA_09256 [Rhizoctonia solani AG-1 IA]